MQERYLGRIQPDMDVCDVNGDKIGTVARVYRCDVAAVSTAAAGDTRPPRQEVVEVKTGFLGLGKHLFIPVDDIRDATEGCLFVSYARNELDHLNYDRKPDYLDELS